MRQAEGASETDTLILGAREAVSDNDGASDDVLGAALLENLGHAGR